MVYYERYVPPTPDRCEETSKKCGWRLLRFSKARDDSTNSPAGSGPKSRLRADQMWASLR